MKLIQFNLNHNIRFKITPRGIEVVRQWSRDLAASMAGRGGEYILPLESHVTPDADGCVRMQFWQFMEYFGGDLARRIDEHIDGLNVELEVDEFLKEVAGEFVDG